MKDHLAKISVLCATVLLCIALLFFSCAMVCDSLAYPLKFISYGGTLSFTEIVIGNITVSTYKASMVMGLLVMALLCVLRKEKYNFSLVNALICSVLLWFFGYAGARILYIFENAIKIIESGSISSGVSFFGAVIFIPLFLRLWTEIIKYDYLDMLNYTTPCIPIMLACIRLGCFCNGCCRGIQFLYKSRPIIVPVQLLESSLDVLIAGYLLKKEKNLYPFFLVLYGGMRFLIEFLRDTPKDKLSLSNGQWFALLALLIGGYYMVKGKQIERRKNASQI